jgi:hypothetical protein
MGKKRNTGKGANSPDPQPIPPDSSASHPVPAPADRPANDDSNRPVDAQWGNRILLVVLAVLVLFLVPFSFIRGGHLPTELRQIVLIFTALFCAMLLGVGSRALAKGKIKDIRFQIVGTGAVFVILYLLFHVFVPKSTNQVARIYLEQQQRPLKADFTVTLRIPGMEDIVKSGTNGSASVELPNDVREVDNIIIDCQGYSLRDVRPFKINNGVIRLAMIPAESPAPIPPTALPPLTVFAGLPKKDVVLNDAPTPVTPSSAVLDYKNVSDVNLRLLIFDCWRYYKSSESDPARTSAWMDFPFDARNEFQHYSGFRGGSGWYAFLVQDSKGNRTVLGIRNLFHKSPTRLTVEGPPDRLTARFED